MGDSLHLFQQVRALIERLMPEPICDACVTERCAPNNGEEIVFKIGELAGTPGFERSIDTCSMCGINKKVTRCVIS